MTLYIPLRMMVKTPTQYILKPFLMVIHGNSWLDIPLQFYEPLYLRNLPTTSSIIVSSSLQFTWFILVEVIPKTFFNQCKRKKITTYMFSHKKIYYRLNKIKHFRDRFVNFIFNIVASEIFILILRSGFIFTKTVEYVQYTSLLNTDRVKISWRKYLTVCSLFKTFSRKKVWITVSLSGRVSFCKGPGWTPFRTVRDNKPGFRKTCTYDFFLTSTFHLLIKDRS